MKKTVLITGASGFIGSHLARRLAAEGASVVGACTHLRAAPAGFRLEVADLRDPESIEALFAAGPFETVFHLAAHGVLAHDDPFATTAVNALGSFTLAKIALRHGVKRFIHCGSGMEYASSGSPVGENAPLAAANLYGASKSAGWLMLDYLRRVEGLPLTTVRPFTVFGPGEADRKLIPYVIQGALRGETLHLTAGTQLRDYVYVTDVVDALLRAAASTGPAGEVFNIGSGPAEARTVRSIVEMTLDLMGAPRVLCRFGGAIRLRPDPPALVSDSTLARAKLGWQPSVPLKQGLLNTILWYRQSAGAAA